MQVSSDYEDLFKILNAFKIKYLVVGAYAVMYYARPRSTKDVDVWIIPELNDVYTIFAALKAFGTPLQGIKPKDFQDKHMIFQIGIAPVRIDIMTNVPGVDFKQAWKNKKRTKYGKTPIYVLGLEDIKRAKITAARPQDFLDLEQLKKQK